MIDDIRAELATIASGQAAANERLGAVEKALSGEHQAGQTRGDDQRRIGERVAIVETNQAHLMATLNGLRTRLDGLLASVLLAGLAWFFTQVNGAGS